MKTKVLTIEQAKYLIEKGVDMSDAKVWWMVNTCNARGRKEDLLPPYITVNKSGPMKVGMTSFERIPTYTLDDIIEKLPNGIPEPAYDGYAEGHATLRFDKTSVWYESWHMDDSAYKCFKEKTLLNSAFEMLKWVTSC